MAKAKAIAYRQLAQHWLLNIFWLILWFFLDGMKLAHWGSDEHMGVLSFEAMMGIFLEVAF